MVKYHFPLSFSLLVLSLAACSSDSAPSDAVEGELSVVMTMGAFDPNFGRGGEMVLFVTIDGKEYRLETLEGSTVIGFDEVTRFSALGGRRVLVAGEIDGEVYSASYAELLSGEGNDSLSLGVTNAVEEQP